ncbi:hypothetical protein HK100_010794, partial [Physocladia obscura]
AAGHVTAFGEAEAEAEADADAEGELRAADAVKGLALYRWLSAASTLRPITPHGAIPAYLRGRHLLAGTLRGADRLRAPPLVFVDEARARLVGFYSLGHALAGHRDTVHGGLLAAIVDESLAFTAIPQLPGRSVALTSKLSLRYVSPTPTGSVIVVATETVAFAGDYDRKVTVRAAVLDAKAVPPESFADPNYDINTGAAEESFEAYTKRIIKTHGRSTVRCVAEAEFVVPRSLAGWLYAWDQAS